jgi:hypothetical protein
MNGLKDPAKCMKLYVYGIAQLFIRDNAVKEASIAAIVEHITTSA